MKKLIKNTMSHKIKRFNENINNILKNPKILSEEEIENITISQNSNIEEFEDIFNKIEEVDNFKFINNDEKSGAHKALMIVKNYLLNRR